jgi:UDP-N-acetylmuramate--alanine ligase
MTLSPTTTALIAMMLEEAGLDPTAVVGGIVPAWNTNARVGKSKWFVVEADEYDYAFLGLEPKIAVLTNVDYDHPDLFPTRAEYQNAFAEFLAQTREDGALIVCGDEHAASALAARVGRKVIRYGLGETNAWRATDLGVNAAGGNNFKIFQEKHFVGDAASKIPGEHNVLNALAAMAVAQECEIAFDVSRSTLAKFIGVERRFQIRGAFHGAMLVDDYAHHPTEIRATLQAARQRFPNARVVALFQPHTFTRTRALWDEFANAFQDADVVLLAEIYAAREKEDAGLSSRALAGRITREHVRFVATLAEAETMLRDELRGGDVLVTLGAGNVNQVIARLLENENA